MPSFLGMRQTLIQHTPVSANSRIDPDDHPDTPEIPRAPCSVDFGHSFHSSPLYLADILAVLDAADLRRDRLISINARAFLA
jgi:hypothetical protein